MLSKIKMSVISLDSSNFEKEVLQSKIPVLVDFWAEWCGPCKMLAPVLEEIALQKDDIKIAKINVDANMSLAQDYKVVSIPMLLLFKDGEVVNKTVGAFPKSELLAFIEQE